ncbi:MAG TPA: DUF523 and DUF1722 domain-containing protein [Bryobacteraceae bacterium]|nr:DUF523 and DUF1722 domain-containing protein [Bryobacteraceae bacterium]
MNAGVALAESGCWQDWHAPDVPLRLGVSACLLGENVRYDGGHARDTFVADTLGQWVEFVPVCPEMEIGMGTPRPTVRLVDDGRGTRLVAPSTGQDFTERMLAYAQTKIAELSQLDLDGYILKKSSPSCGMERLPVYRNGRPWRRDSPGLFAGRLLELWPALPSEEEGRLNNPKLRENFIERVFCRNRWRVLVKRGLSRQSLVQFHTAHKLLLRAHNEAAYRRLGKLVAGFGTVPDHELFAAYESSFQNALRAQATRKKHANVLYHALGYLKKALGPMEKHQLLTAIEDYRGGLLPLIVPLTLLRYEIRRHGVEYLAGQLYFDPHPKELMLRNHV